MREHSRFAYFPKRGSAMPFMVTAAEYPNDLADKMRKTLALQPSASCFRCILRIKERA